MNYYEQFYDDLEFAEEDVKDEFDARNYRQKPYSRNEERPGKGKRGRGQNKGQGLGWEQGQGRGQGQNRGRGQGQNRGRGKNQGQSKPAQEAPKGKIVKGIKMTNFVKAGELAPDNDKPFVQYPTTVENTGQSAQQAAQQPTQNYNSQSAGQENNAFNYANPLYGYGEGSDFSSYGSQYNQYGGEATYPPGTQPTGEAGSMPGYESMYQYDNSGYYTGYENYSGYENYTGYENHQWGYGSYWPQEGMNQSGAGYNTGYEGAPGDYSMGQQGASEDHHLQGDPAAVPMEYSNNSTESKSKPRKPTVLPSMNFVKSTTEFKSMDIVPKTRIEHLNVTATPKPGTSRAGLGFGKPVSVIQPGPSESLDIAEQDAKFVKLVEAVKARNGPNRNAIEVLNMAVQKVKNMVLNFDIDPVVSTLANFQCIVTANGIHIGRAADSKKKSAKNKSAVEAVALLTCGKPLTVRKSSDGHYELKPKVVDVLRPVVIADSTTGKKVYAPSQGGITTTKKQVSINITSGKAEPVSSAQVAAAYSKPKIVFHPAGQSSTPNVNSTSLSWSVTDSIKSKEGLSVSESSVEVENVQAVSQSSVETNETQVTSTAENSDTNQLQPLSSVKEEILSKPKIVFHSARLPSETSSASKAPAGFVKEGDKPKQDEKSSVTGTVAVSKKPTAPFKKKKNPPDFSKFILLKRSYVEVSKKVFLAQSADFNHVPISYEFEKTSSGFDCSVMLGKNEMGSGFGSSKDEAKDAAVDEAVSRLEHICYTVVVKVQAGRDENPVDICKRDLEADCKDNVLPDTNIGNALLRKMGWSGGGIGKDGTGIKEPIKTDNMIGRQGLGFMGKSAKSFIDNATKILNDYKHSGTDTEIHFSPELTKEERAKVHQIAQKLKLRSVSYGKGEERYLTISQRRNLKQLLNHVVESGGATDKYEILPPKNQGITCDIFRRDAGGVSHNKQ